MTLACTTCGCTDLDPVADNGAEYPQTRVEFYECADCGHMTRKVLSA